MVTKTASELTNRDSTWDWEWLYFTAKHLFHMSDEEFWHMTPRKYFSLMLQYVKFLEAKYGGSSTPSEEANAPTSNAPMYIDQLF